jgi:hypothetical protein
VGCANYYTLLFSCPIIYLNYFWCIKYQHINVYMKMEKEMGKGKRKRDSQLARPRGFRPSRARVRARARAGGPPGSLAGERRGDGIVGVGPRARERGGLTAWSGDGGRTGRGPTTGEAPRRFSAGAPVLRWGSGGEARAGVGDHGGRPNLAGGCLGWPVHGAVADARGGEVIGDATVRNKRRGGVC